MLNQRLSAAQGVAKELFPAEETLENALLHTSRIVIAVIEGRRTAKLPFGTAQEGLERAGAAASLLIQARAELGAAHLAFRETQEEIGLRAVSFGDIWECPSKGESAPATIVQPLRAV
ncbi:MAG: hypothetical protein ABIQ32_09270 [Sphingomicrobium sp.]